MAKINFTFVFNLGKLVKNEESGKIRKMKNEKIKLQTEF